MTAAAITTELAAKLPAHVSKEVQEWLRDNAVEPHYTVDQAAELLGKVTVRTVWNYVELGKTSQGKEGIYPVVKLSHKVVLLPASSINRFLKSRRVSA